MYKSEKKEQSIQTYKKEETIIVASMFFMCCIFLFYLLFLLVTQKILERVWVCLCAIEQKKKKIIMFGVLKSVFSSVFGTNRKRNRSCIEQNARAQQSNVQKVHQKSYQHQIADVYDSSDLIGTFFMYVPMYDRIKQLRRVSPFWHVLVMKPRFFQSYTFNLETFWVNDFIDNRACMDVFLHWLPYMQTLRFNTFDSIETAPDGTIIVDENKLKLVCDIPCMLNMFEKIKLSPVTSIQYGGGVDLWDIVLKKFYAIDHRVFVNVTNLVIPANTSLYGHIREMPRLRNIDIGFFATRQATIFSLDHKIPLQNLQRLRYCRDYSGKNDFFNRVSDLNTREIIDEVLPIHIDSPQCPPELHTFAYMNTFHVAIDHYIPLLHDILTNHQTITSICLRLTQRRENDPTKSGDRDFDLDIRFDKKIESMHCVQIENAWLNAWTCYPHVRSLDLSGWFANLGILTVAVNEDTTVEMYMRFKDDQNEVWKNRIERLNCALDVSFPGLECIYLSHLSTAASAQTLLYQHSNLRVVVFNVVPHESFGGTGILQAQSMDHVIYCDWTNTRTLININELRENPGQNTFLETIIEHLHYVNRHLFDYGLDTPKQQFTFVWKNIDDSVLIRN